MKPAASALTVGQRIANRILSIGWEDHGGPIARREVADAAAESLGAAFTQNEYRVFPRGARWIVKFRPARSQ